MTQKISSSATSLNQVASTFKRVELPKGLNLDYGGGRYDKASDELVERGVLNLVYDPFNRNETHNLMARASVFFAGGADSATVNNVLNVIDDDGALLEVVRQTANGIKSDAKAHFLIYEGDASSCATSTSKGWQRNAKSENYRVFLEAYFSDVSRKGNLFSCSGPIRTPKNDIFSRDSIVADAKRLASKMGVPVPSKGKIGKHIGGAVYLHRSAAEPLPEWAKILASKLPPDASWDVVKLDEKNGQASFISSPDFLFSDEPTVGNAWKVSSDGKIHLTRGKEDPQIYHHKWSFMADDGSKEWMRSLLRSVLWSSLPDVDKSRIGNRSFWEREVLPRLPLIPELSFRLDETTRMASMR